MIIAEVFSTNFTNEYKKVNTVAAKMRQILFLITLATQKQVIHREASGVVVRAFGMKRQSNK